MKEREIAEMKRVRIKLIEKEQNEEYLKDKKYIDFVDMAAVPIAEMEDGKFGTFHVRGGMNPGKKEQQMFTEFLTSEAIRAGMETGGTVIKTMTECMKEIGVVLDEKICENEMFIVTNSDGKFGAEAIFYPDFNEKAKKMIGREFYMLPSSVHEWIVVKKEVEGDLKRLKKTVEEINRTEVDPCERMSDSVYEYDAGEGLLRKVM